jgi:protein SCO1/2
MFKKTTFVLIALVLGAGVCASSNALAASAGKHVATGIVLKMDAAHHTIEVSCDEIPDYMSAMEMDFTLRDSGGAPVLKAGTKIRFTIEEVGKFLYAEDIEVLPVGVFEPEPMEAAGLSALQRALEPGLAAKQVAVGQVAPDFTLTDQAGSEVRLSQFEGKVVALTFGYSRCPNPNYCYRLSNNLAYLQKRLRDRGGKDLVLLTIAIDPEHDKGEVLAEYAAAFKADVGMWHFLSGPLPEIRRVAATFGLNFWSTEGLITHTMHTVVIDRRGKVAANLEGNQFSPQQLKDLVEDVMKRAE